MNEFLLDDIVSVGKTDVGLTRKLNEDAFLDRAQSGIWLVADGMGGLSHGERASGMIVDRLRTIEFSNKLDDTVNQVCNVLESVNAELRDESDGKVSGSTVVVFIIRDKRFACVWAGDSRLYRHSSLGLERLSKDHSVVEQLVDAGAIEPEQARHHPMSNRITRAIGTETGLELDTMQGKLQAGDRFLLCTDGLHGMVDTAVIEGILRNGEAGPTVDRLIEAAIEGGGRDNVSVIVVDVPSDTDLDSTLISR